MFRLQFVQGALCLLLAIACPSLPLRAQEAAQFPGRLGLEDKWRQLQGKEELEPAAIAKLIREDPEGSNLVRWGGARYTSLSAGIYRRLSKLPKMLAELADMQDVEAQTLLERVSGLEKILQIARRYPWARPVHRALMEVGSQSLQRGHAQLACGCFQDVLTCSADPALRNQAQVGLWLAISHEPSPEALENAFVGIDLNAQYPWFDKNLSAAEIRDRLVRKSVQKTVELKDLDLKILNLPASQSSAFAQPSAHAEGLVIAGPNTATWFHGNEARALWTKTEGADALPPLLSGLLFQPATAKGWLFTRWGTTKAAANHRVTNLAAFGLRTGNKIWSTSERSEWQDLCPVSDPTVADGRVYVLAVSTKADFAPIFLICLDAEQGRLLWKRELVSNHMSVARPRNFKSKVDLAHFGLPVTVSHGNVYCATNMGATACCDARDGAIKWVRTYPRNWASGTVVRPGSAPFIAGSRVIFLPRDTTLVLALELATGDLSWLRAESAALQIVGSADKAVILAGSSKISAIMEDTGAIRWDRIMPEAMHGKTVLAGQAIFVGSRGKIYRLDAQTGKTIEEKTLNGLDSLEGMILRENALLFFCADSPSIPSDSPDQSSGTNIVYRSKPLLVDGKISDWDKYKTTSWGSDRVQGKALLAHDSQNLYIGLHAKGTNLESRVDLTIKMGDKYANWTVTPDGEFSITKRKPKDRNKDRDRDRDRYRGLPVPANGRAVATQDGDDAVTYEIAIPLAVLFPKRPATNRLELELLLINPDTPLTPTVKLHEDLLLNHLTLTQEAAALAAVRALPGLPQAWKMREELSRITLGEFGVNADFYSEIILEDPKGPGVREALVRMDRLLNANSFRRNGNVNVLEFAEEVGVPESVRQWYKDISSAYLSQWLFIDAKSRLEAVEIELLDTRGGIHKFVMQRDAVPVREWYEWKIPLLSANLFDQPIAGINFKQRGGGDIFWDQTALVVNDKRFILFENDLSGGYSTGKWQWVEDKVKRSQKSHMTQAPKKSQTVHHAVTFKQAQAGYFGAAPESNDRLMAAAIEALPDMAFSPLAVTLLERAQESLRNNKEALTKLQLSILQKSEPADLPDWLEHLERFESEGNNPRARETVQNLIQKSGLPAEVLQDFNKRPVRQFLQDWHVIGPFPVANSAEDEIELEVTGVDLDQTYSIRGADVPWKQVKAPTNRLDLKNVFGKDNAGSVYAACWIHNEGKKKKISLNVCSDDRIQVWINPDRSTKPAIDEPFFRVSGQFREAVQVDLKPGSNLVLIKLDCRSQRHSFSVELRDEENVKTLGGLDAER